MTVLSVIQGATKVIGLTVPTAVMASTDRTMVELAALANEMADRIAKAHEWQLLRTIATYTGNGIIEDFNLPSDYDRMGTANQVWSSSLQAPLTAWTDLDAWLGMDVQNIDMLFGAWIIYGGQIHIKSALANLATAKHWYQSNLIITPATPGLNITAFAADGDTFRLNERLLRLAMIWQWKANKGRPYGEDLDNYEEAKEKLIVADKGSRVLTMGRRRRHWDGATPFPRIVTP